MKGPAFGAHLPVMGLEEDERSGHDILSLARKAEELGFDSLSVNDHVAFTTSWVDPISALAPAASVTRKIKLGTPILNIVVRNPVVSATQLSAIDILSDGRLFAGVGPGSRKSDYEAASIPYEERWVDSMRAWPFFQIFGPLGHQSVITGCTTSLRNSRSGPDRSKFPILQ